MSATSLLKALVVEDQELFREAIADELKFFGFQASTAIDGEDGFKTATESHFDLILSDMRMPNRDGKWLLNELRKMQKTAPPFIFMTGFTDLSPQDAFAMGADGFLAKPLDSEKLNEMITKVCKPIDSRWNEKPIGMPLERLERNFLSLEAARSAAQIALGRGGMFVASQETPLRIGDLLEIDISFKEGPILTIAGIGRVIWRRESGHSRDNCGYGIDFEFLSETSRPAWIRYLRENEMVSFVPKG